MTAQPVSASRVFLDAQFVKAQVAALRHAYPELDEDATLLEDMIEGETDFSKVLTQLIRMQSDAEHFAIAIDVQMKKLAVRQDRYISKRTNLRAIIQELMDATGQKKVVLPEATLSLSQSRAGCIVTDETVLPDEFVRIERIPRKTEITAALLAGERVQGAELTNTKTHLTIRT